jgi:hypothetical protein
MEIAVVPVGFPASDDIRQRTRAAVRNVQLDRSVARLELCFDAPEFEGSGYWTVERQEDGSLHATLYGSPLDVLEPPPRGLDPRIDLDLPQLLLREGVRIDPLRLDRWLHRNLLQLDDLIQGRVRPDQVPAERSAGLQAVWDVWTDGRLRLWQHPGMSQAERRRLFFRTFAAHGLLLPRHWATFHDLWECRVENQSGLLASLERLPPA